MRVLTLKGGLFKKLLWPLAYLLPVLAGIGVAPEGFAREPIRVVTTTTVLKHFVEVLGKDSVQVYSIGKPYQDPHLTQATPQDILRVRKAQVFLWTGSDEEQWTVSVLRNAGNRRLVVVDASKGITWLNAPKAAASASGGHIHTRGNPYYWMDPFNAEIILGNIFQAISFVSAKDRKFFDANRRAYLVALRARLAKWQEQMAPLKGTMVVSYHDIWPYFAKRFGLNILRPIEPQAGIPPSPKDLRDIISEMQLEEVKIIIQVPFYASSTPAMVARAAGAKRVALPISQGKKYGTETYFDLFERNIRTLLKVAGK